MQRYISSKFNKRILCVLILFVMIYTMFSFIPQFMTKSYATEKPTYTYSKTSNDLPADFDSKYPGYKSLLQTLAEAHPDWTFKLYETGLDWETTIIAEYQGHGSSPKNLTQNKTQWICPICGTKEYDNGTWKCASYKAIAYMMDPRNSINESDVFQFQDLSYIDIDDKTIKKDREAIETMVKGTFIDSKQCIDAIFEAAKNNEVSPYHLVSRILQEQGENGSTLGLGITVSGGYKIDKTGKYAILTPKENIATGSTTSREGKTYTAITLGDVNGDGKVKATDYMKIKAYIMGTSKLTDTEKLAADVNEDGQIKATDYMKIKSYIMGSTDITVKDALGGKKYYNLFNIGATGNSSSTIIANGLKKAQEEGWTSMASSIKGGAKFLVESYIAVKQNTVYYQKFNVVNENNLYNHQYMQNVTAAQTEGEKIREVYSKHGILESNFVFNIPLYKEMPSTASAKPVPGTLSASEFMKITASSLNLRKEPKTTSEIIGSLKYGTLVKKVEDAGSWYKVLTPKGIGYMTSEYLKEY